MPSRPDPAAPPPGADLDELRLAAATCTACELYRDATQTVFGAGDPHARVMLVGEQPGDREDRAGEPFVGPAGRLLDEALVDAGIDRGRAYVTNAVKHFRFTPARGGKVRLHQSPTVTQIRICSPWLEAEIERIEPELIVALGATAAKSLRGQSFRVTQSRGTLLEHGKTMFLATAHPSAVLRADDREAAYGALVADLRVGAGYLAD